MVACTIDRCHCMVLVKYWHGLTVHVMAVAGVNCGEEHKNKKYIVSLCKLFVKSNTKKIEHKYVHRFNYYLQTM